MQVFHDKLKCHIKDTEMLGSFKFYVTIPMKEPCHFIPGMMNNVDLI